jgi:hypothetical protein
MNPDDFPEATGEIPKIGSRFREEKISPCFHEFTPSLQSIASVVSPRDGRSGSPLDTQGRSRVPELGSLGSVLFGGPMRLRWFHGRSPFDRAPNQNRISCHALSRLSARGSAKASHIVAVSRSDLRRDIAMYEVARPRERSRWQPRSREPDALYARAGNRRSPAGDCGPTPKGHAPAKYSGVCPTILRTPC